MVTELPTPKDPQAFQRTEVLFVDGELSLTRVTHLPGSGWEQHGLVEFHLKKLGDERDALRVDSYKAGYFAASMEVAAGLEEFLPAADGYIAEFEEGLDPEKPHDAILIPVSGISEGVFEGSYTRPMTMEDLKDKNLPTGGDVNNIGLLRLDNPMGDVFWDKFNVSDLRLIGVIAPSETDSIGKVITATSRFINNINPQLPAEMVTRTLTFLPHIKPSQEPQG